MTPIPNRAPNPRRRDAARAGVPILTPAYETLDDQALLGLMLSRSEGDPDRLARGLLGN